MPKPVTNKAKAPKTKKSVSLSDYEKSVALAIKNGTDHPAHDAPLKKEWNGIKWVAIEN